MSPKAAGSSSRARPPTTQESLEEGNRGDSNDEGLVPSLNQLGYREFDQVISPPSNRDTRTPAGATRSSFERFSTPRAEILSAQHSRQQEQLDRLFELVEKIGSGVRSEVSATLVNGSNVRDEGSAPSPKGKGKALAKQHITSDEDEFDNNHDNGEDPLEYDDMDDYVNHAYYREKIAEGFCNRAPSRLASNKPGYFPIDEPLLRTLVASKYSAKAPEYTITVANAVFTSVTRATIDDAITTTNDGNSKTGSILLSQVSNTLESMLQDRMFFLDLSSDLNTSATEKDFTNNVLRNEFTLGVQNKGGGLRQVQQGLRGLSSIVLQGNRVCRCQGHCKPTSCLLTRHKQQ